MTNVSSICYRNVGVKQFEEKCDKTVTAYSCSKTLYLESSTIRNEFGKIQETEHQFQIHHENVQYSHCLTDHFQAFPNTAVKIVSKDSIVLIKLTFYSYCCS